MIKKIIFLAAVFILFSFVSKQPVILNSGDCRIENNAFEDGEKLVYKLYYNLGFLWIPAGETTFNIKENEDSYEISADGKTYPSYDSFFKVRDYYYTKIDKETLYPISFVRHVAEGNYRKYDSVFFDQKSLKAISVNGKTKETAKIEEFELQECMQDLVSVLYSFRNIKVDHLKKGEYIPTKIFFDREVFPIKLQYEGKQKKKKIKNLGKFRTFKVVPELIVGEVFKKGDKMNIWVSDDENKLPLLIESPISVGSVKAVLKSYDGLRHPLTSKH